MGIQSVQIIFDNPTGKFMPGQTITGRVLIGVSSSSVKIRSRWIYTFVMCIAWNLSPKFVLGIKLKFKGEAKVSWTEQESRRNDNGETENYSVKYDADEEYFENKSTLVGGGGMFFYLIVML